MACIHIVIVCKYLYANNSLNWSSWHVKTSKAIYIQCCNGNMKCVPSNNEKCMTYLSYHNLIIRDFNFGLKLFWPDMLSFINPGWEDVMGIILCRPPLLQIHNTNYYQYVKTGLLCCLGRHTGLVRNVQTP